MQDGAPPHIARRVKDLLRRSFGDDRVLSRHFHHAWPPRSPDLSPCDYWLWGYLKLQVYRDRPTSPGMLKDNIRLQCLTITPDMLYSAVHNIIPRLQLLSYSEARRSFVNPIDEVSKIKKCMVGRRVSAAAESTFVIFIQRRKDLDRERSAGRLDACQHYSQCATLPLRVHIAKETTPEGLGSNTGEDMDVCKSIVPSRHGGTPNSRRAASPLVRLVKGDERREAGSGPSKLGWNRAKSFCHLYGAQGYVQRQAYI
ncbi:transposable element Tcb1 transposase [Trichonephila clavipes]|nr:transposable element Tcb1 transposase [Trichonephila clavipes]